MKNILKFVTSWNAADSNLISTKQIIDWIRECNQSVTVQINKAEMKDGDFWFYDTEDGSIHNRNRSFFSIVGIKSKDISGASLEQPIILQKEIGYLGIICKEFNGILHFLMQAKIEPGNVNKVQISPTIQATKSNFTQKHGGKKPAYLDYFLEASRYHIIVDQIQSEQSSRFYKKRNRNIIIDIGDNEVEVLPNYRWMTLGQIKQLLKIDNLVNMDTRTVLSCIPYALWELSEDGKDTIKALFKDKPLFRSIFTQNEENLLPDIYQYINNYKMFWKPELKFCPLDKLSEWNRRPSGIYCNKPYPFQVIYCDITIEGREVTHWKQPLFEALGVATFGIFTCVEKGTRKFLVHAKPEIGCFDSIELAPTVQQEAVSYSAAHNGVTQLFWEKYRSGEGVKTDIMLSEEGGRFYHEQNKNVIIEIRRNELPKLPPGYFWSDYRTLNLLGQINNCLNIQLRNLLSLLEV